MDDFWRIYGIGRGIGEKRADMRVDELVFKVDEEGSTKNKDSEEEGYVVFSCGPFAWRLKGRQFLHLGRSG